MPTAPIYQVVVNHEEQYRVIPAGAKIPKGWRSPGLPQGALDEIEAQLKRVWVKRRPGELERVLKAAANK
jgi:uncharacterized protein YbdZ (MbtH family)